MKQFLPALFLIISGLNLVAQSAADAAVQLSVGVQSSPPQITLNWTTGATATQYQLFRKLKSASSWGTAIAVLPGSATQFIDNSVSTGTNYEYKAVRTATNYTGYGYVNAGIEVPETAYKGKLILVVDSSLISPLTFEIDRLIKDIEGDGWEIVRHNVLDNGSVLHVKSLIINSYNLDPLNTRAVFLLGHVPVPYSGFINPDGHPDHFGAWPADVYYGDMDGLWTDLYGPGSSTASPTRTQNYPNDGKFDQSVVPGDVELQVGRVDFNNMPTFTLTTIQLTKNYLDKDHEYRKKIYTPLKRAVIDDNFGYFSSEAFAASGYKNFGPLVGASNISAADYFTTMTGGSYLWSYGCGGGTYTSASGVGTTANFAAASLQGVFTMLFGSYFGDWDAQNSFLKAPLAQGKVLTNVWSGRPHYQFHHMGLGENIGFSLLQTQNNPANLYFASPTGITGKWIHNALMGDPTLRNDVIAPVANVVATKAGYNCVVSWSASSETNIAGYNIYMKNDTNSTYIKVNAAPVAGTSYTDNCLMYKGIYTYLVRTLKLETTPSGSYYNLSEGIADTALNNNDFVGLSGFTSAVSANTVQLTHTSTVTATYAWDFGNGTTSTLADPSVVYTANGNYFITLVATHPCLNDTSYSLVIITEVGINDNTTQKDLIIYPNPSSGFILIATGNNDKFDLNIYSLEGKIVSSKSRLTPGELIDLRALSRGTYFAEIITLSGKTTKKLILE